MSEAKSDTDQLEEDCSVEVDGRLSAIMPRKLFQDDAAVKSGLLQVFVRMKPVPQSTETCMQLDQSHLLKATWRNKEAVYKFSKVFQQDADQADVYDGTTAALVDDFLQMRQPSAVVMAYGVTNAGKTFTMTGTPDRPGLVPQAMKHIFKNCNKGLCISLSVMEIYNECVHDLLAPGAVRVARPAALRLKEDRTGHITVQGLSEVPVSSVREAQELLRKAAKARQSSGTNANERSSRSHAVIMVKLCEAPGSCSSSNTLEGPPATGGLLSQLRQQHQQRQRQSQLCFVDLAGCERVKRTGNSGARLRESVAINSSLMTLARCLEVLRYNQQHPSDQKVIPFRESKITHLFKDVLHGNGRFVMVVNVSPAAQEFNETKRVLQYAALASKVTMTSEVEHDILVGPEGAWGAAAAAGQQPPGGAAAAVGAEALAAAEAAAAAARGALSAAQARIDELLDDKADLEYEVDVVERKVELLREELIKAEVEKETLEAEIRAEVVADMQMLLNSATAQHKAAADKAARELAAATQEAAALAAKVSELEVQLQAAADRAAQQQADIQARICRSEHDRALQQARAVAVAEAQHRARVQHELQVSERHYQQQLTVLQQELSTLQQQLVAWKQDQQQQVLEARAAAAEAESCMMELRAVATEALQVALSGTLQQKKQQQELVDHSLHLQQLCQSLQQQQQQRLPLSQQGAASTDKAGAAAGARQHVDVTGMSPSTDQPQPSQQQQQPHAMSQITRHQQQPLLQHPQQEQGLLTCDQPETQAQQQQQRQPICVGRPGRSNRRSTLATAAATAAAAAAAVTGFSTSQSTRRRRQTLASAPSGGPPAGTTDTMTVQALAAPAACAAAGTAVNNEEQVQSGPGGRRCLQVLGLSSIAEADEGCCEDGRLDTTQAFAAVDTSTAAAAAQASAGPAGCIADAHEEQQQSRRARKRSAAHLQEGPGQQQQLLQAEAVADQEPMQQSEQQQQQQALHARQRKRPRRESAVVRRHQQGAADAAAPAADAAHGAAADADAAAGDDGGAAQHVSALAAAAVAAGGPEVGLAAACTTRRRRKTLTATKLHPSCASSQKQRSDSAVEAALAAEALAPQQQELVVQEDLPGPLPLHQQQQQQRQRRRQGATAAAAVHADAAALPVVPEEPEQAAAPEPSPQQQCLPCAGPSSSPEQQQEQPHIPEQQGAQSQRRRQLKQQQQQQAVLDTSGEVWQSAELVLRDVTTQQQLGPLCRGRRATVATMGGPCADGDAAAAHGAGSGCGAAAGSEADGVPTSSTTSGGGSSRWAKRQAVTAAAAGAGKAAGGCGNKGSRQGVDGKAAGAHLLVVGGGVTPVAFRTRHRRQ